MNDQTIFIIDDDSSVRNGLTRLIKAHGFNVESFSSAKEFLTSGNLDNPGCIILDVQMPGMTGPELQQELGKTSSRLPIIFLSAHGDVPMTAEVMKKGAIHFLTKPVDQKELLQTLNEALSIDSNYRALHADDIEIENKLKKLTPREFEVMRNIITGMLNKQIAHKMGISIETVKIHRGRIMFKLEIQSVAELVRLCEKMSISPANVSN